MTDQMPQVNAEFGTTPVIEFPTPEAPKGLKVVELTAASRRPASAARTRWCSSSTSFPPADHRSAHDERRGHSRRFVINNEDCFSIDNGSGGRYG